MDKTARLVQVHCKECGEDFKLDVGDATPEEVEAELAARDTFECPGHHVELSSPMNYWEIDWESAEEGSAPTDEEWLAKLKESYDEVYDSAQAVKDAGIEITSFAFGIPMAKDVETGKDINLDFASAPSGKRYYYVVSRNWGSRREAAEDYGNMTDEEFDDCLKDVLNDKSAAELLDIGDLYSILVEEFNDDVLDMVGEDADDEEYDRTLWQIINDQTSGALLSIPGLYEVVSEEFNDEALDCWDKSRKASRKEADEEYFLVVCDDCGWVGPEEDVRAELYEELGMVNICPECGGLDTLHDADEEDRRQYRKEHMPKEPTDTELGIDDREASTKKIAAWGLELSYVVKEIEDYMKDYDLTKEEAEQMQDDDMAYAGRIEDALNQVTYGQFGMLDGDVRNHAPMSREEILSALPVLENQEALELAIILPPEGDAIYVQWGLEETREQVMAVEAKKKRDKDLSDDDRIALAAREGELTEKIMAAAAKRLMFQEIQDFDMGNDSSFIRELEMTLENGANNNVPLMLQFFQDMKVYGLDEAVTYAEGYEHQGELDEGTSRNLREVAERIKKEMGVTGSKKEANVQPDDVFEAILRGAEEGAMDAIAKVEGLPSNTTVLAETSEYVLAAWFKAGKDQAPEFVTWSKDKSGSGVGIGHYFFGVDGLGQAVQDFKERAGEEAGEVKLPEGLPSSEVKEVEPEPAAEEAPEMPPAESRRQRSRHRADSG